jgi:hypothetical protein
MWALCYDSPHVGDGSRAFEMKGYKWEIIVLLLLLLSLTMVRVASAQDPPSVTTNAASGVTSDSATLNGTLTSLGNTTSVDVSFEWGLTISYGNETTPQTMPGTGAFNDGISGLDPGTTYHFRAKAVGNGTAYGDDATFTTGTTPPSVTTNAASGVTSDSATLNGTLTSLGTATSVDVSFEWGLTISYGNETTPQTMPGTGAFNDGIGGLDPDTTYHFRAKAVGDGTVYGDDVTFSTGQGELVISEVSAVDITNISAVITWRTDRAGSSTVNYGNTTGLGSTAFGGANVTEHNVVLTNLSPSTLYYYEVVSSDGGGNTTIDNNGGYYYTFTTLDDINLEGWAWYSHYGYLVPAILDGYVAMFERPHVSGSFSLHVVGNLTMCLPGASGNETIELDMYGSRSRSLFYLRQEMTGKSASLQGTWIDAGNDTYYICATGRVALPNPEGDDFKTARLYFVVLRTPDVDVPLVAPGGSFIQSLEAIITIIASFVDTFLDWMAAGLADTVSKILFQLTKLVAALRGTGTPYVP